MELSVNDKLAKISCSYNLQEWCDDCFATRMMWWLLCYLRCEPKTCMHEVLSLPDIYLYRQLCYESMNLISYLWTRVSSNLAMVRRMQAWWSLSPPPLPCFKLTFSCITLREHAFFCVSLCYKGQANFFLFFVSRTRSLYEMCRSCYNSYVTGKNGSVWLILSVLNNYGQTICTE